jgi:hypothetical protein
VIWKGQLYFQFVDDLSISSGGTLTLLGDLPVTGSLTVDGKLDLGTATLHWGSALSDADHLRDLLLLGTGGHAGITSSATNSSIGVGVSPVGNVHIARFGDANLDGTVSFADLLILAQHYGNTDAFWYQGDFNYDGKVDFTDLLKLAQNDGKSLASPAAAATPLANSAGAGSEVSKLGRRGRTSRV